MEDCIFCKIINHELPAKFRYEDNDFVAFDDIRPSAVVDILLVPKNHIVSVAELDENDRELAGKLLLTAKKVASEAGLESFRLVFNSGSDAGQEVNHLHGHILGGERLGKIA